MKHEAGTDELTVKRRPPTTNRTGGFESEAPVRSITPLRAPGAQSRPGTDDRSMRILSRVTRAGGRFRVCAAGATSGLALLVLSGCNGGTGTGAPNAAALPAAPGPAVQGFQRDAMQTPPLPPQGIYDQKCEPKWILETCKANDLQAAKAGLKMKVSYIGLSSEPYQFKALLKYDESIGITQYVAVAAADQDGLAGTDLISLAEGDGGNWPKTCKNGSGPGGSAVTNKEFMKCIDDDLRDFPAFGGWYLYDEPGCPNAKEGYCWASLKPSQDVNVTDIAAYLRSIDSHRVIGANSGGSYSQYCQKTCVHDEMANTFKWLTDEKTPFTGGDYYPVGCPSGNDCNQQISDLAIDVPAIVHAMENALDAKHQNAKREKFEWVEQAFDWSEEAQCPPTTCSFPTAAQMQEMRDTTLWYSAAAGNPVWSIWWFAQNDANCQIRPVQGCDATARWSALTQAINAPYPTKPPGS
jgi:hypothetical protein